MLLRLLESFRSYRMSRDALEEYQRRKVLRSLRWAYQYVPMYRTWFKQIGKTPYDFGRTADIRKLPVMSKGDLLTNYPGRVVVKGMKQQIGFETTGTTGKPVVVHWTGEMNDARQALGIRRLLKFGVRPWDKLATIWPKKVVWHNSSDSRL